MKKIEFAFLIAFYSINLISQNITQKYDQLNQLSIVNISNGTQVSYSYDEVGNRIGMIVTKNTTTDLSNNIAQLGFKLYPNPTTENFCISGFEGNATLKLIDISGKVLLVKQVSSDEIISISFLPKGIYIVELITKKGVIEKKLLKK